MNKKALLVVILLVIIILFAGYQLVFLKSANMGGLRVVSNPSATIFLNDKLIGKTVYEDKLPVGEHVIKLIPEDAATGASSWQGKIMINPSVLTYVNRDLGTSELTSAGEVLTLEKISQDKAQLVVFSQPDAATVILDGHEEKVTPLSISDITSGEHDIAVASPGFISRTVRILATPGYKLVVNFQLALASGQELPIEGAPTPSSAVGKESSLKNIKIKDTPTGFLRVRSGPSTASDEVAQVKPGDTYPYTEEQNGWYKISYAEGKEGWISGRYAEKAE